MHDKVNKIGFICCTIHIIFRGVHGVELGHVVVFFHSNLTFLS